MTNKLIFLGDVWMPYLLRSRVRFEGEYIPNLEAPITSLGKPTAGKINLKSDKIFLTETFGKPPLAVCLANNHIMDYGEKGFSETLKTLEEQNIRYFGAGKLAGNCNNPLIVVCNGLKVALLGYVCPSTHPVFATRYAPGVMAIDLKKMKQDIVECNRMGASRIVITLHWGEEEICLPNPSDVTLAHKIIELGADLIIGHHAHCIQPFEIIRGRHVFYGLGNCVFPNFSIPSCYDDNGVSTRNSTKKQKIWNRRSIAVTYEAGAESVSIDHLEFKKDCLSFLPKCRKNLLCSELTYRSFKMYKRKYNYAKKLCIIRYILGRFISQPKFPRVRHVKALLKLLKKKPIQE